MKNIFGHLLGFFFATTLVSCATTPSHPAPSPTLGSETTEPQTIVPGGPGAKTETAGGTYGPSAQVQKKIVLVLGPGQARAFAAAGAFRALEEAGIEVGAVLGTGMGALLAALYADSANLNEFEWNLMRLKPEILQGSRLRRWIGSVNPGTDIEAYLLRTFGTKDIKQTKRPLVLGLFSQTQNRFVMVDQGPLVTAVRSAIAEPGVMTPGKWQNQSAISCSTLQPYLVDIAKDLGIGPVVVVDTLADFEQSPDAAGPAATLIQNYVLARANGEAALNRAAVIIRPELTDVGFFDFDERAKISFKGKTSVQSEIEKIKDALEGTGP